jgi:hypothetical protein
MRGCLFLGTYDGMYSMVIVEPLLATTLPTLDPVKADLEKASAPTAKIAALKTVKDFMVLLIFCRYRSCSCN